MAQWRKGINTQKLSGFRVNIEISFSILQLCRCAVVPLYLCAPDPFPIIKKNDL